MRVRITRLVPKHWLTYGVATPRSDLLSVGSGRGVSLGHSGAECHERRRSFRSVKGSAHCEGNGVVNATREAFFSRQRLSGFAQQSGRSLAARLVV